MRKPARAQIYGHEYSLMPLDPRIENIQDILATDLTSATELLERHPDFLFEVRLDTSLCKNFPRMVNRIRDLRPAEKVLIVKNGGIGDHITFLPALQVYRDLLPPDTQIWIAAQTDMHPLYSHHAGICRLLPLPLPLDRLMEADALIDFSSRQDWYDLKSVNFTDGHLNFLGIDYRAFHDKRPRLSPHQDDSPRVYNLLLNVRKQHPEKPIVLLNWRASNRLRDMPPEKILFLTRRHGDLLFMVAQPRGYSAETASLLKEFGGNLLDVSPHMNTLRDYICAMANCDAVVSTDTGTVHLAEAIGRPCVAIYGPTIDDIWVRYYKNVRPLRADYSGRSCSSPCGMTRNMDRGCPEAVLTGNAYSPCLLSIPEQRIEAAFAEMMEEMQDRIQDAGCKIRIQDHQRETHAGIETSTTDRPSSFTPG